MENEKTKILDDIIKTIKKEYGDESIVRLGKKSNLKIDTLTTDCLTLDLAIGGGLPRGRIIEVYGPEASGKTTVALHCIAGAQKSGHIAAFIDAEHALDPLYAKKIGVDIENLILSQPDDGEQALDICASLIATKMVDLIVIDSVAALTPRSEIEGDMGDQHVGAQARLMSQALRKLTAMTSKSQTSILFINQLREKVGVMFGSPETTAGGKALKFYSTLRIDIRKSDVLKNDKGTYGIHIKAKIVKNKIAPPFKVVEFDIIFGKGIFKAGCLLDAAIYYDVIKKSGSWFSYKDAKLGQGRENVAFLLEKDKELYEEISNIVREKYIQESESDYIMCEEDNNENKDAQ